MNKTTQGWGMGSQEFGTVVTGVFGTVVTGVFGTVVTGVCLWL
jgi:hypothetical protein